MIQSLEKQLQVVIRALGDVVTPALEGGEKHVLEQLQVSMATLAFVLKRLPEARRFYRHELKSYLGLADALLAASPEVLADARAELERFAGEGRATLDRPEADLADFELATRRLRESVARLAEAAQDAALRRQLETIILEQSEPIIAQARQWCTPFGFELRPQSLPPAAW